MDTTSITHRLVPTSEIVSAPVHNPAGEKLGKIQDVMVDLATGRIAYSILSFGGFLGMGNKLFAIPWGALALDQDEKSFVLNVERELLENAPGFEKDEWPDMADSRWGTTIHTYYGVRPYWE